MKKLLMAGGLAVVLLTSACATVQPPPTVAQATCGQTLEQADTLIRGDGFGARSDFTEPKWVKLAADFVSAGGGKPVEADTVTTYEQGALGVMLLSKSGCVTGYVRGDKARIAAMITTFQRTGKIVRGQSAGIEA